MKLNILKTTQNHYFLVDSGSDVSLIQKDCIRGETHCNPSVKLNLQGISEHNIKTLAVVDAAIQFPNFEVFSHEFHIFKCNFKLN